MNIKCSRHYSATTMSVRGSLTVKLDFAACGDADVFAAAFCARQEPGEERRGALW